jgi:ribosomal protein S6E (S10)
MAQKILEQIVSIAGNTPGAATASKATIDLTVGPRYLVLWLIGTVKRAGTSATAPVLGDIFDLTSTVKVKINGKTQREFTLDELDAIQRSYGAAYGVNVTGGTDTGGVPQAGDTCTYRVPILFYQDWRPGYSARDMMAWPTAWPDGSMFKTLQVEVPLAAKDSTTDNVTSEHAFSVWAEYDNVLGPMGKDGKPILNIEKWSRLVVPYSAAGELPLTNLDRRDYLQQFTFFGQSGDLLLKMRVKMNGRVYRGDVPKVTNEETLRKRGMIIADQPDYLGDHLAANRYDTVFEDTDNPLDSLPLFTASSFEVTPTLGAADADNKTLVLLQLRYGPPD